MYDHFRENDFKFPGELGGMPLPFHDIGHVLAGYGTDPQSEIQQANADIRASAQALISFATGVGLTAGYILAGLVGEKMAGAFFLTAKVTKADKIAVMFDFTCKMAPRP